MVVQALRQRAQSVVDRVAPPETRRQVSANAQQFAREQPVLAIFLFVQVVLSALPVLLFASFAAGTILLAFFAAVAFSLFWVGIALLLLVPTLFVTFSIGIFVWLWAVGTWLSVSFAYNFINDRREKRAGYAPVKKVEPNGAT
ncbi:MAG: hypothetical protein M4579_000275 [Chaenotheca gracillima]|nr:MAG: hypothetical protein M4579_000275 [Chaenotheca gracillima]